MGENLYICLEVVPRGPLQGKIIVNKDSLPLQQYLFTSSVTCSGLPNPVVLLPHLCNNIFSTINYYMTVWTGEGGGVQSVNVNF